MSTNSDLVNTFEEVVAEGLAYLREATELWEQDRSTPTSVDSGEVAEFLQELPPATAAKLRSAESHITDWAASAGAIIRSSPLSTAADLGELRVNVRKLVAALSFRDYSFHEASLMWYEDTVYGLDPARQDERDLLPPAADRYFVAAAENIRRLLLFAKGTESGDGMPIQRLPSAAPGIKQRPDTAFIMMWMSDDHPELIDVKNGIVEVFREFDIEAIRADDIEHEGVITERILQEISSAEFLIADLTGARPNVYYEIGYAHALEPVS
jgi:hypothetical protein